MDDNSETCKLSDREKSLLDDNISLKVSTTTCATNM